MERDEIKEAIRSAFADVRLGSGFSLRQAQAIDGTIFGHEPWHGGPHPDEIIDDWTRVPESELLRDNIAHLDADGLHYYLPALMLWLLDHYNDEDRLFTDGAEMTAIGTMMALAPPPMFAGNYRDAYDSFSAEQKAAIASYVEALPRLVNLDYGDATEIEASLDDYWAQFLPVLCDLSRVGEMRGRTGRKVFANVTRLAMLENLSYSGTTTTGRPVNLLSCRAITSTTVAAFASSMSPSNATCHPEPASSEKETSVESMRRRYDPQPSIGTAFHRRGVSVGAMASDRIPRSGSPSSPRIKYSSISPALAIGCSRSDLVAVELPPVLL